MLNSEVLYFTLTRLGSITTPPKCRQAQKHINDCLHSKFLHQPYDRITRYDGPILGTTKPIAVYYEYHLYITISVIFEWFPRGINWASSHGAESHSLLWQLYLWLVAEEMHTNTPNIILCSYPSFNDWASLFHIFFIHLLTVVLVQILNILYYR